MYAVITHIMEVNFMKKILALLLVLIMAVSTFPLTAFAVNEEKVASNDIESMDPETASALPNADERFLVMLQGETINVFKQYKITPNKGWAMWVNITSLSGSFTVTVRKSNGTAVWTETVPAGGQIKQKIVNSCNGNYYTVDFLGTGNFTVVGGLYQTEVI